MVFTNKKFFTNIFGGIIFMIGDTIASLMANQFSFVRAFAVFIIGSSLYAFEIQLFFQWVDKFIKRYNRNKRKKRIMKSVVALLFFNPLWIARHLFILYVVSGNYSSVSMHLFKIAVISFLVNIPISIIANYYIQNKIVLKNRFIASAIFSGLMAIYYSMSAQWF